PDPDAKGSILPIHPGVAAYLSSGDESFFEQSQKYFYLGGLALSVAGSLLAAASSYWNRRKSDEDWRPIARVIRIADEALGADTLQFEALEREFQALVSSVLGES